MNRSHKEKYGFSGKAKAFISIGAFIALAGIIALFAVHQINQFALAEEKIIEEQIRQVEMANAPDSTNEDSGNRTTTGSATNRPRTTNTTSRTCMADGCTRPGTRSFEGIFSNQTEWYCLTHYNELQDMLDIFN